VIQSRTPDRPWSSIIDPTNPFKVDGISNECRALLRYVEDAKASTGDDVVVTCTTDHPLLTTSGSISLHRSVGTMGEGRAIDLRMRTRGLDIHRPAFDLFRPVELLLSELIYADAPYNIKDGRRVDPYARAFHHDHAHAAVPTGRFPAYVTRPEEVPAMFPAAGFALARPEARDPETGLVAFYTWTEDGSVYAWNGAPGPVPNGEGKAAILADAGGPVRSLLPLADGSFVLVAGEPMPGSRWRTYRNVDLDPAHRS
jgi:hypothetical protein